MNHDPDEQRYNDDLLLKAQDRERAERQYPSAFHVLDHPQLREEFVRYDPPANEAKRRSRRSGIAAIALGFLALSGAATASVYHDAHPLIPQLIGLFSALAGVMSLAIGMGGVLHSNSKLEWLCNRFMAERLRQLHFQTMLMRLPDIIESFRSDNKRAAFTASRELWLEEFLDRHEGKLNATVTGVLTEAGSSPWLLPYRPEVVKHTIEESLAAATQAQQRGLAELLDAYRKLRIEHQIRYADHKLRKTGRLLSPSPQQQRAILRNVTVFALIALFSIHLFVAFLLALSLIPGLLPTPTSLIYSTLVHVVVVLLALLALATRAVDEGLSPSKEIDRYRDYRAVLRSLRDRFDDAPDEVTKITVMTELERESYQEMCSFLGTHNEAHFVM